MVKYNLNEQNLKNINSELLLFSYHNDTDKIRKYFKSLLTNCLEALAENDYSKYSIATAVLNEGIIRVGSNIDNFEDFYSNLKNEVAIDFLKKVLQVDDIPVLTNNPVEAILITPEKAEEIKKIWDYLHYSVTKEQLYNYHKREENYTVVENEAYTVLINAFVIIIINKSDTSGTYLDTNYNFKLGLDSEVDVLKGFVTNEPDLITPLTVSERIFLAEQEVDYSKFDYKYMYNSLDDDTIYYYNESDDFLVLINEDFYEIINKKTGKSINFFLYHFQDRLSKTIRFLATFSDYCLGSEGRLKEDLLQNVDNFSDDLVEDTSTV
jgi:hypothetical protein